MNSPDKVKILLAETSPILMSGLTGIISQFKDFNIVERITDYRFLHDAISKHKPDIMIASPMILPDNYRRNDIRQSLSIPSRMRIAAICPMMPEESFISQFDFMISLYDTPSSIARKIRKSLESKTDDDRRPEGNELSEREKEILVAVARGKTNKEIADEFSISIYTVITHRKNISQKTGIKSIAGLTVYAMLNNLISMDEI